METFEVGMLWNNETQEDPALKINMNKFSFYIAVSPGMIYVNVLYTSEFG